MSFFNTFDISHRSFKILQQEIERNKEKKVQYINCEFVIAWLNYI